MSITESITEAIRRFLRLETPTPATAPSGNALSDEECELNAARARLSQLEDELARVVDLHTIELENLRQLVDMDRPTADSMVQQETSKRHVVRLEQHLAELQAEVDSAREAAKTAEKRVEERRWNMLVAQFQMEAEHLIQRGFEFQAEWSEAAADHVHRAALAGVPTRLAGRTSLGRVLETEMRIAQAVGFQNMLLKHDEETRRHR